MAIHEQPAPPPIRDEDRSVLMGVVLDQMAVDPFFASECLGTALENGGGIVAALEGDYTGVRLSDDQLLAAAMGAHRAQRPTTESQPDLT